ncbi:MAG: glycosyltransferase family 4 protein [Candidatus Berkelbacteria bacterium]|nr:glycosyltransferase family 4 protein [Candidatus Berkelbacteria bacterium]MCR4308049.1 glycosyltransferase family 4 protein [Candidatus Berkelbacteria bacterium]
MKIGLDLRFWRSGTGGLGRYSRNLLKELLVIDQENSYTAIITPDDEPEFDLHAPNLTKLVVPTVHYSMSEQTKLPRILKAQNFDLVHFTNFNHPILYRRPFVVTIHDLIMHLYPTGAQKKSLIRKIAYRWTMRDCKRAKKIIVPSESTRRDLVGMLHYRHDKIVITPEGSEKMFRVHTEREKIAVKERLGLPKKYLLFVSRWEAYKGLPALLTAHEKLAEQFPDLGLVICGRSDTQNPQIAELVKQKQAANPNIVTPGFVSDEDLAAIYSAALTYVHPSMYEGFGIMVLEAFASGVPVVTSNTSSLPEVVGDAGVSVDPKNLDELANAIEKILINKELAEELVAKGLERVKQYSWRQMAASTLAVYRDVASS